MKLIPSLALFCVALAQCLSAQDRPISFKGTFVDFLVHMAVEHGIEGGLDPEMMSEPAIRTVAQYDSKPSEKVPEFMKRVALSIGGSLQVIPPSYYYFTKNESTNLAKAFAAFQFAKYQECLRLMDNQNQSDPDVNAICGLARLFVESASQTAAEQKKLNAMVAELKGSVARARFFATDRALGSAEMALARQNAGTIEQAIQSLKTSWQFQFLQLKNTINVPKEVADSYRVLSSTTVSRSWTELVLQSLDRCLHTLSTFRTLPSIPNIEGGRTRPGAPSGPAPAGGAGPAPAVGTPVQTGADEVVFPDAGEFYVALNEVRSAIYEIYSRKKFDEQQMQRAYQEAYKAWSDKNYEEAFSRYSALQEAGDSRNPSVRIGFGLLAVKVKTESVKRVKQGLTGSVPKQIVQQILDDQALCPAGVCESLLSALNDDYHLGLKIIPSSNSKHQGRIGAIYGLGVFANTGQGKSSTKAIQLLPKVPNRATGKQVGSKDMTFNMDELLPSDSYEEQVEIHGIDARLDKYSLASIKDSLRYVSTSKVPDLYKKYRVSVVFEKTVGINTGGDSAGAAFALAALSAAKQSMTASDICVTDAIRPYGEISAVGGIFPKATAAAAEGFKILLVPDANLIDLQLLDFDKLGCLQIITGRTIDDYIEYALPVLAGDSQNADWSLQAYALAFLLYRSGEYPTSKAILEKLVERTPQHMSAQMLLAKLNLAGVQVSRIPLHLAQWLQPPSTMPVQGVGGGLVSATTGFGAKGLRIIRATYGAGNSVVDVTGRIRDAIRDNSLSIHADTTTIAGHDPASGQTKELRIIYSLGSRQFLSVVKENETAVVPDPKGVPVTAQGDQSITMTRQDASSKEDSGGMKQLIETMQRKAENTNRGRGNFELIQAYCGAEGSWRDVTAVLQKMTQGNVLSGSFKQPYAEIGGDPAFGKVKMLAVTYRHLGKIQTRTFREENPPVGLQFSLP